MPVGRLGFGFGFGEWLGDGEGLGDVLGEVLGDVVGVAVGLTGAVRLGDGEAVVALAFWLVCAAALPIDGMRTTLRVMAAAPASAHARRRYSMPRRRDISRRVRRNSGLRRGDRIVLLVARTG